jgi:hypothetical protein
LFAALKRFAASFAVAGLIAAAGPAHADIEKFMRDCDMKLCVFYRASITVPDGCAFSKLSNPLRRTIFPF